jgi:hypothetical protein
LFKPLKRGIMRPFDLIFAVLAPEPATVFALKLVVSFQECFRKMAVGRRFSPEPWGVAGDYPFFHPTVSYPVANYHQP